MFKCVVSGTLSENVSALVSCFPNDKDGCYNLSHILSIGYSQYIHFLFVFIIVELLCMVVSMTVIRMWSTQMR